MTRTEQEIEKIIQPIIEKLNYSLYDVEYVKEGSDWYLRVYIDNKNGINLDDCEKVSNELSILLDKDDPINSTYFLEVSSCGVERHLRNKQHYEMAIDKKVQIKLFKPIYKKKEIVGKLVKVVNDKIYIEEIDNKEMEIELINIASAKILYDWEE